MWIRLLSLLAVLVSLAAASAAPSLAVPPCWPDCEGPAEEPYFATPIGKWDNPPAFEGRGTPYDGSDDARVFSGWALDSDKGTGPISVRLDVYRYDQRVPGWAVWYDRSYVVLADQYRSDIDLALGVGRNHGFRIEIPTMTGDYYTTLLAKVCMTAINYGAGMDAPLSASKQTMQSSGNCWLNVWLE